MTTTTENLLDASSALISVAVQELDEALAEFSRADTTLSKWSVIDRMLEIRQTLDGYYVIKGGDTDET